MEGKMKNKLAFYLILAFLVMTLTGSFLLAQNARPKVVFKEKEWDFGHIKQGEVVTHEFIFRNEGNAPLKVSRVSTSCGCTAALVSANELAPGQEGRLKVTFDSRGYYDKVVKYIYFESNDPEKPRVELSISTFVEVGPSPRVELDRYNVDLGISLEGEEASTVITLKNTGQLELMVDSEMSETSFYVKGKKISFPFRIPAGKSVEMEVRFPGKSGRLGLLRDYILLKTNDPVRSTLSIFVTRYVITREELKKLFEKYGKELGIK
jgi:hypothetical protein